MKWLREIRKKKRLSQVDLERLTGIDANTFSRYERGVISPSPHALQKIANALNVTVDELLNGPERTEWVLNIRIVKDLEEVEIDMTDGGCISNIDLSRKGAALTLGANYETFADDSKFNALLEQLERARKFIVESGGKMAAMTPALAGA